MPTYDYECKSCGHVFEFFQSMSDDPLKECPKCGSPVRRLIGGGLGIIFKGSGFYVTDNKSGGGSGNAAKTGSTSPEDKSKEKSSDKSTDTAPKVEAKKEKVKSKAE